MSTSEQLIEDRMRELHENTDFMSALFENLVGYGIIAADFDGNILAYNEGARGCSHHMSARPAPFGDATSDFTRALAHNIPGGPDDGPGD